MNQVTDERKRNASKRVRSNRARLLFELIVLRGNYKRGEQRMHQNGLAFMPELHRWISKLTAGHLQLVHQEIF